MIKSHHISLLFLMCLLSLSSKGQIALDRVLIGSGYTEFASTDLNLSASVGEPITTTLQNGDLFFTQGFQQSNYVLNNPFILELQATKAACFGANDGTVSITFISENITAPLTYSWSNGATTPQIIQADTGRYFLTVTGSNGNSVVNSVKVLANDSVDCKPQFYSGITPNGDNFNDYWHIDNADYFAQKEVQIFNRYGSIVWENKDYTNLNSTFVGQHKNGNELPDGTYFYIAKFDGSTYKGWIEISR